MKSGLILAGEPMGLLIAQSEGSLDSVSGYDLAVAGAEFNVAVGVARLGHRVTYMTKLGKDPFGQRIIHVLDDNNIGNVEKIHFEDYSHIHLTGILPALTETTRAAVNLMFDKARQAGLLISFDPNLRPQLWPSQEVMVQSINEMAAKADIVLPGTAEGKILMGSEDPKAINDFYLKNGAKVVITKCGGDGAYVSTKDESYMVPGFTVDKVVDTVGAGDGFAAGVITGLMEGLPLKEAVRRGNAIGAIQVTSRGDNEGLPYPDQLKAFMEK